MKPLIRPSVSDLRGEGLPRVRNGLLDAIRGVALVWAASDHVFMVLDAPYGARLLARPAVVILALVAGMVWRPGNYRRALQVAGAGVVTTALASGVSNVLPDVMLSFGLGFLILAAGIRPNLPYGVLLGSSATLIGLGVWGPQFWLGYSPFALAGLVLLGRLLPPASLGGRPLPSVLEPFAWLGRRPLAFWILHWVGIVGLGRLVGVL